MSIRVKHPGQLAMPRFQVRQIEREFRLDSQELERVDHFTVNECPQPQLDASFGFRNLNPWNITVFS